jgi:hypothetical protein
LEATLMLKFYQTPLLISAKGFAFLGADVSLLGYACGVSI